MFNRIAMQTLESHWLADLGEKEFRELLPDLSLGNTP